MTPQQLKADNPQLIKTAEGFSVLYNERYLYSKYKPTAAVLKLLQNEVVQEQTLVFCFSPLLGYGLSELLAKIPESSRIICIECTKDLYDFSLMHAQEVLLNSTNSLTYLFCKTEHDFSDFIAHSSTKPNLAEFRRICFFDLSAGTQFSPDLYKRIRFLAEDFLSTFWRNRLTLTHFAKLYFRNIFRNLPKISQAKGIQKQCVEKQILVLGAGPSIDEIIDKIFPYRSRFFIVAADSVINPLLHRDIKPDVVIALESQIANEKAFIGTSNAKVPFIADLTSRPALVRLFSNNSDLMFLFSQFADSAFLKRLLPLLKTVPSIPPLGSVGLAALELALLLRKNDTIPVYFAGLDFSFTPAKTHCRAAPSSLILLSKHNRVLPLQDAFYAFQNGARSIQGKSCSSIFTTPALQGYAAMLGARFATNPNVFDIAPIGLETACKQMDIKEVIASIESSSKTHNCTEFFVDSKKNTVKEIIQFIQKEIEHLTSLRNILINGGSEVERNKILTECDYLYLHFPDGHLGVQNTLSFLKRVRAEIDVFLKDLNSSLRVLS